MSPENDAFATLANSDFPLFAAPPAEWTGDVFVRGCWGTVAHPIAVTFSYVDDASSPPGKGAIDIVCTGPEGREARLEEDLRDEHSYPNEIVNFLRRHTATSERGTPGPDHFGGKVPHPSAGARTERSPLQIEVGGEATVIRRVNFVERPNLKAHLLEKATVEILLLSWRVGDRFLGNFISTLRPCVEFLADLRLAEIQAWQRIKARRRLE